MQVVYAAHLPLPRLEGDRELQEAIAAVQAWCQRRFRVALSPLSGGEATSGDVRVTWSSMTGLREGIFTAWVDQGDAYDATWRWRTFIDIGVENGAAWARVRVHLSSVFDGLLASPRVQAGRPGIVRDLVKAFRLESDGLALGTVSSVDGPESAAFLRLLLDGQRRLPIVAVSTDEAGAQALDTKHLADRLLGLAHVVSLSTRAAYNLTNEVGRNLSCYLGAVRVYWPGFRATDDSWHHRLFMSSIVRYLGPEGVEAELFEILGRVAGYAIDEPPLRRKLVLARRRDEREADVAARAEALRKVSIARDEKGQISASEFAEFVEDYEAMAARVDELDRQIGDLELDKSALRRERDDSRDQLASIWKDMRVGNTSSANESAPKAPPQTVSEAVERAIEDCSSLLILSEAEESAAESGYADPQRVLEDLRFLDEVSARWKSGELAVGPHQEFKEKLSGYRDGIGQKAETQYKSDYERLVDGKKIVLGPHISHGTGAVANIMRIYFYIDKDARRIVVGHVGRKLRDNSNRN